LRRAERAVAGLSADDDADEDAIRAEFAAMFEAVV
jgi:hypothetical protein